MESRRHERRSTRARRQRASQSSWSSRKPRRPREPCPHRPRPVSDTRRGRKRHLPRSTERKNVAGRVPCGHGQVSDTRRVARGPAVRFAEALSQPGFGAVAEFKRRSPSAGDIRADARVEDVVPAYEAGGARAISVLVDAAFGGSLDDLRAARAAAGDVPLLAKGFFLLEEDLRDVRDAGAD